MKALCRAGFEVRNTGLAVLKGTDSSSEPQIGQDGEPEVESGEFGWDPGRGVLACAC